MSAVRSYRDLQVWQKAMELVEVTYVQTSSFPDREVYGLTSQMRRSAVSIPSNIAEGQRRDTVKEFLRYLSVARGSIQELQTQFDLALRFRYLPPEAHGSILRLSSEVHRLINGLANALRAKGCPHPRQEKRRTTN